MRNRFFLFVLAVLLSLPAVASAGVAGHYTLILKKGKFAPNPLTLPANKKIKLVVKNETPIPAEFESSDLDREQVVSAQDYITVYLGPLDPGTYAYFNDFNRKITGKITVK